MPTSSESSSAGPSGRLPEAADAVVVGAGVAGLFAAHFLARAGLRPLVLEQSYHAGGCLNGFTRKGFTFDAGDQSFEELGIVFPLLADLDLLGRFEFRRSTYRLVAPGMDAVIDSIDTLERAFLGAFPQDVLGVRSLFRALGEAEALIIPLLGQAGPLYGRGARRGAALARAGLHVARHGGRLREMMNTGARELASAHIEDPELRSFVSRIGYKNMSWAVLAGFLHCWVHDYWYPQGGLQAFCDGLAGALRERGGEVFFKTPVARILVDNGRVTGVETARGERIATRQVVACGDMKRLYSKLLPPEALRAAAREEVARADLSEALTSVYLGIDASPEQLAPILKTQHVFYFPELRIHDPEETTDAGLHRGAWLEVSCPTLADPSLAPPGKSVIVLQTMAPAAWLDRWGRDGRATKEVYRALKDRVAEEMIATAEGLVPDLSGKILFRDVGTPLSAERFTFNAAGATGGWTFDPDRSLLRDRYTLITTPIKGLHAAGHYALWPGGVPSAALSARLAALLASRPALAAVARLAERGAARIAKRR